MPVSATITAYYTFSPSTKARASQVNANFSNYRGHLVPIDGSLAAAANNFYDLGSNEYFWRNGYIGTLYIKSSTSTGADLQITGDTTATGAMLFKVGSTTLSARILPSGFDGTTIKSGTISPAKMLSRAETTAADIGQLALSNEIVSTWHTTGTFNAMELASSCTITTTGRPIFVGITANDTDAVFQVTVRDATFSSYDAWVAVCRDTTTSIAFRMPLKGFAFGGLQTDIPLTGYRIDWRAAGTYRYFLYFKGQAGNGGVTATSAYTMRVIAFEL